MNPNDIDPKDYKFIGKPDKDFNPAHNKKIIAETISESTKFFKEIEGVVTDDIKERIEAVASYGRYRLNNGSKTVEGYLGEKIYKQLVGEHLIEKIKMMKSVDHLKGIQREKYFIPL